MRGIYGASMPDLDIGDAMRVLRMLKIIRWFRKRHNGAFTGDPNATHFINPSVLTLVHLILSLIISWHWTSCIYFYLSELSHTADSSTLFNGGAFSPTPNLFAAGTFVRGIHAYYWAVAISTQVTDPLPDTVPQLIFSLLVAAGGVLAISLVFGAATAVVADMLAQQSEREGKLQRIVRYTNYKQLPAALRHRIISYYAFHLQSAQMSDDSVLNSLPRSLKLQIDVVTHQQVFLKLPLFRLCEREEILMLTQSLRPGLALPDEALVREGEYGVGLFFLMKGGVEVLKQGQRVCFVYAVAAFGESALLRDAKPVATVRAVRFCEVNVLMRVDFERVAVLNPNILRYLQLYTVQRDAQMKEQTALERDKGRPTQGRSSPARPFDDGDEGSLRGTQRHVTIRESFNDTIRRSFRRLSLNTVTPVPAVVPPPSAATAGAEGAGALGQEPATADDDDDGSIERSVVERIKLTDMDHREHQATHR